MFGYPALPLSIYVRSAVADVTIDPSRLILHAAAWFLANNKIRKITSAILRFRYCVKNRTPSEITKLVSHSGILCKFNTGITNACRLFGAVGRRKLAGYGEL